MMARLKQSAAQTAQLYRAMGYDVAGAQRVAAAWHQRYNALPTDTPAPQVLRRLRQRDPCRRAARRPHRGPRGRPARTSTASPPATTTPRPAMADANSAIEALAAERSTALTAVQAARGSDVALEAGNASPSPGSSAPRSSRCRGRWPRAGDTVAGHRDVHLPLDGVITSPFGMRFHPILHYTKLHTGTDFAGGSVIRAADDGRVIMTIVSTAYGNFTVIDHGMVDGKHLTTAYAHQSRFLVHGGRSCKWRADRDRRPDRLRHRSAPALRGARRRCHRRPDAVPRLTLRQVA